MKTLKIESIDDLNKVAIQFIETTNDIIDFECYIESSKQLKNEINCIAFYGEMGAGKTTFIKALCQELHVIDIANSPTFAIINEYKTEVEYPVYHFDFYRINKISEAQEIGTEEYFYSGNLCLIEWPENIESMLPEECLKVKISEVADGCREIQIQTS